MPGLKLITFSLLLFLTTLSPAADPLYNNRAEEAVRQVLQAASNALVSGDTHALEQIYSSDCVFINASGSVLTRAQRINDFTSGEWKYESIETDQIKVRIYENTAVATMRSVIKGQSKEQDLGGTYRLTTVLVKSKKGWQIVVQQSTTIPQRTQ